MSRHNLLVDEFHHVTSSTHRNFDFVVTHAHSDHAVIPNKFPFAVLCTPETKFLISKAYPNIAVKLLGVLHINSWFLCKSGLEIYCFDSGHCIGGVGVYCPQTSLLHFGDGRPQDDVLETVFAEIKNKPPKNKLRAVCDTYMNSRFPSHSFDFPSIAQSRAVVFDFLTFIRQTYPEFSIEIQIAHFGSLDCLPKNFGYYWKKEDAKSTPAAELCVSGFQLHDFIPGPICVTRIHRNHSQKKNSSTTTFNIKIMLSASWWFLPEQQHLHLPLGAPALDTTKNAIRIFACSHASSMNLIEKFQGVCNMKQKKAERGG